MFFKKQQLENAKAPDSTIMLKATMLISHKLEELIKKIDILIIEVQDLSSKFDASPSQEETY